MPMVPSHLTSPFPSEAEEQEWLFVSSRGPVYTSCLSARQGPFALCLLPYPPPPHPTAHTPACGPALVSRLATPSLVPSGPTQSCTSSRFPVDLGGRRRVGAEAGALWGHPCWKQCEAVQRTGPPQACRSTGAGSARVWWKRAPPQGSERSVPQVFSLTPSPLTHPPTTTSVNLRVPNAPRPADSHASTLLG